MEWDKRLDDLVEGWGGRSLGHEREKMCVVPKGVLELLLAAAFGPAEFVEERYLADHPDVAAAVRNGTLVSGLAHYLHAGLVEGRRLTTRDFSEAEYLEMYPDVRSAVSKNWIGSGYDHWAGGGWIEGRLGRKPVLKQIVKG
jgi:hypothetical protein